jgi:geranylgeranyl diphosphate synthase type II
MVSMDLKQSLTFFDSFLETSCQAYFPEPSLLNQSIKYSLFAGGKRIRPLFCLGFSQIYNGNNDFSLRCALAVEMIHTYSLIHDDLPAMDNDDLRRGKPTNHKIYGEAHAILAGDALLTAAPEILMKELIKLGINPISVIEITTQLLSASGHNGMIKGQALDMEAEEKATSLMSETVDLEMIHLHKTGKLIQWSCLSGLYSTGDEELIKKNKDFVLRLGEKLGLLFQIVDDVLDVTATREEIGKTPGKDKESGKLTYTSKYGLNKTKEMANRLIQEIESEFENSFQDLKQTLIIQEIIQLIKRNLSL